MKWMMFLLAVCTVRGNLMADAPVAYFDAVDKTIIPAREFMPRVSDVKPDWRAHKAGVRPGDFIAGVDGLRARCGSDVILLLRQAAANTNAAEAALHVVRGGQWLDITVPNRASPGVWTGIKFQNPDSQTLKKLVAWGVEIETLPTHDTNPGTGEKIPTPTRELAQQKNEAREADPFSRAVNRMGHGVQPWFALSHSAFRMQEALCGLADKGDEDDRAWAQNFVHALRCLLMENYEGAKEFLTPLLERKTEPFLDGLVKFYVAVTREQGNFTGAEDWKKCGVDVNFFSICYPYPTLPRKVVHDIFAFDPDIQAAYETRLAATSGATDDARKEAAAKLSARVEKLAANPGLAYRMHVASALLDGNASYSNSRENSAILMRNPHQTLAKLKENWELCPDERNLTAFALLFSSLWLRDEPAFRMALRHIYTLGTLEVELAHNILFRTQSTLYPDMADICHRVWREEYQAAADGYDALPQIYKHLASRSAIHRERFRRGFFSTPYTLLRDGGNFCQAAPWLVANALQRDDSAQTLGRMLEPPATFSLPRQEARELLKTYVENYHWIMDAHNFPRLAALLNRVPQDAAHNDMIALIHQHIEFFGMFDNYTETEFAGIPDATHIIATKNTPWMEWLARLDQSSFQAAKNAAERVRNGANPKAALRGALQNAATPAALLVLWRAAREAGEKELADEFYNMAWRFHYEAWFVRGMHHTANLWAARAYLAEPDIKAFESWMLGPWTWNTRAYHALHACSFYYKGELGKAAQRLALLKAGPSRDIHPDNAKHPITTLIWENEIIPVDEYIEKLTRAVEAAQAGIQGPPAPPPVPW